MSRTLQSTVSRVSRQQRMICLLVSACFCLVLIFSGIERAGAAGGGLDPLFNPGGAGTDGFGVTGVAVQPDGKIIIGGHFASYNGDAAASDGIARLNTDGTLDTTFNMGGVGLGTQVGGVPSNAHVVALQPDGKILVGGNFTRYNGDEAASDNITRLNTNGTLDTTFNYGGAGANATVNAVAVQADGKIIIGGHFNTYNGDTNISDYIVRLNTNGTLDTSFNMGGTGANGGMDAVTVLPDGKILIGGNFTTYNDDANANDYIARLNTNGTLDTSFNMGGTGANGSLNAVTVQPDGKIIIGGGFTSYNGDANASDRIARLNANGTLDTTFNYGGTGASNILVEVALQPDGKILIAGPFTTYNGANASDYIARLNTNGTLDTSFNMGGTGADAGVNAVVVQPDGKILIAGGFTSYNGDDGASDHVERLLPAPGEIAFSSATYSVDETAGNATITLTRTGGTDNKVVAKVTLADGTTTPADYRFTPGAFDTSFNLGGAGADDIVTAVAVQPDGKIIIAGNFTIYNGDSAARDRIARLNTDGTLDTTFNMGGTGADNLVFAVALQPDGKILIAGLFTSYNGDANASDNIARLNTDGTLDTSFNMGGAGANGGAQAVAVQPDGKIIIAGLFTSYNNDTYASDRIARLNTDGTLDTTFNYLSAGANTQVSTVAVQADGKILIGGVFTSYNGDAAASDGIARLNIDGTLDTTFNMGGAGVNDSVNEVAVQADGKILVGGQFTGYNGDTAASDNIVRLNTDGTLDTSFNPGGAGANNPVLAVALQPDGKILIGGAFTSYNGNIAASDYIVRLNSNGTLDTSFNPGGTGANNAVFAVAVQPDGKILIGGNLTSYNGSSAASDYIARLDGDLFVTWPAGDATNKTIQLPIINDGLNEPDETLNLSLAVLSGGATLGSPNTATLTILDPNDAPVNTVPAPQSTNENTPLVFSSANTNQISIADVDADTSPMQVTLTATHGTLTLNGTTGLSFITGDGTDDATMSFTGTITAINAALDGLSFNPTPGYSGAASLQLVSDDLGNTGAGGAQSDTDTINITINEAGVLKLSAATYSVNEATASLTINVTRTGGSAGATSVHYATVNGTATGGATCTAGKDYVTKTGTLSWAVGDMANKTFTVPICNDTVFEGNETVNLTLSNVTGSASLGSPSAAVLTIVDNETQPKISVNDVTVTEGNAGMLNANFMVKLSGASSKTVTVKYATSNGTALAGSDYVAVPLTTLTFTPGQTSKTVAVAVKGDTLDEANETFRIILTGQTNATILDGLGIGTITDNDPTPRLSINNVSLTEGNAGTKAFTFTVSLSAASGQAVSVKYATSNGTAVAPADYTAKPLTTLTFTPGQTTKTVTVLVRGETVLEGNETFFVNLSLPVNATILDTQGQGTITNDD
ncbi:MAG: Calx-beta domain-containing protein [Pyrinomonadaceae bacterium]